ncbi:hypothetical protein RHSIM_Rhsim05G0191900 [Rhododendron simsii]|uniref:Uncharacterized protein n=1 Tax=Rhododendron simsii TaxID=118357 RepID=A0A834LR35_RHOSS|nr:hypothetical protein RHSIM_Rhsim05G0191900 [Rhododendron simsii]
MFTIANFSLESAAIFTFSKQTQSQIRSSFDRCFWFNDSMTATMFENHAVEYFLVDGKTLMKYVAENDQNVVAIFPKLAMENEYWIQLKTREYPSHGVKVLAYNINNIKAAFNEDSSKEDQPTTTANSPLAKNKAKKKLFQEDDNPTTTSEETQ